MCVCARANGGISPWNLGKIQMARQVSVCDLLNQLLIKSDNSIGVAACTKSSR